VIVRSWNLRPRPGRYDDAIGLITEGVKLADRHGAGDTRLTQAATAGPTTGLLVLTCDFESLSAYGRYLDEMATDAEAQSYNHRIREAEAPFVYESTAVLYEIDLERPDAKRGRGRVLDARFGRPLPGRWGDNLTFARAAFDLCDKHGAVGQATRGWPTRTPATSSTRCVTTARSSRSPRASSPRSSSSKDLRGQRL
jgi:hypothetical protein